MDDELHQLEAELKRLRPAATSATLRVRLESELAPASVARVQRNGEHGVTRRWWLWAGALPAAAALVVAVVIVTRRGTAVLPAAAPPVVASSQSEPPAIPREIFKPVAAENVLYAVNDDGLVTLDDGTAARRERLSYVDTITWKNPRTNASVRWTVPREEVRIVPVKFQ
jgi:hypothetical protein